MANIANVDYEAMPSQASSMRTLGQDINTIFTTIYQNIENMHNNWYGKRYDDLAKQFNALIPDINSLLQIVVGDIPYMLETVANNYAKADKGSTVTSAEQTEPEKINDLPILNDTGLKFVTNEVETTKATVSQDFKNAVDKMNAIESAYGEIQWESEASKAFAEKFKSLKASIISSFENLDTQFTTLMDQTLSDIQATEDANTVQ